MKTITVILGFLSLILTLEITRAKKERKKQLLLIAIVINIIITTRLSFIFLDMGVPLALLVCNLTLMTIAIREVFINYKSKWNLNEYISDCYLNN